MSLWSLQRIRGFRDSLSLTEDRALAVLELDQLALRVPVFEGTDDLVLNRGAGWIQGTARPGEDGNVGIAGHRDGFFRGLMHAQMGDPIRLRAPTRTMSYRIDGIEIVEPEDVYVLLPRALPSITLVTCYPFYYTGSAPHRFIVHATLQREGGSEE
jgi:sortase A